MLIVQTPFRLTFFGGGTDMPKYYEQHGGKVLNATFDKYCYHTIRYFPQFFDWKNQFTYSKIERFDSADEVEHPAVREALKHLDMKEIQITYDADLPARSGLGSSSSNMVGLLNGLHSLRGEFVDKMTLAKEAVYVERTLCNEEGGVQDQLAAAFGGLNHMEFNSDGITVTPLIVKKQRKQQLNDHLLMLFTGFVRYSGDTLAEQIRNTEMNISELKEIASLVDEGEKILLGDRDICDFGRLLDHSWNIKKTLSSKISNSDIDEIYATAIKNGALGGKLMGAGAGGFMLLFAKPENHEAIKSALNKFKTIPFEFENSGTKVVYYKP